MCFMNKLEIFKSTNRVRKLLKERRLKEAFALLNELNCKVENWQVGEELRRMEETYADPTQWNRMSLHNIARSGIFAADRSIAEYADNIWHVEHR